MGVFIETPEERLVVNDVPDAIVHFFEPDRSAVERLTQKVLSRVQPEGAGVTDAPDLKVAGVLRRQGAVAIGTDRLGPARGGGVVLKGFVWAQLVVGVPERITATRGLRHVQPTTMRGGVRLSFQAASRRRSSSSGHTANCRSKRLMTSFHLSPALRTIPRYRRNLLEKWKEVPRDLYQAGKISVQPKLDASRLGELLRYRHD